MTLRPLPKKELPKYWTTAQIKVKLIAPVVKNSQPKASTKKVNEKVEPSGNLSLRLQRNVNIAIPDGKIRKELDQAIKERGMGFIKTAEGKDRYDFQVVINTQNELEIQDSTGNPLPNLPPAISVDEKGSAIQVANRLLHLAKYRNVQELTNHHSTLANRLRVELLGGEDVTGSDQPIFHPNKTVILHIYHDLSSDLHNSNVFPLYITVLDLSPDGSITQLISSESIKSEESIERKLTTYLPQDVDESQDILKIFATQQPTDLDGLTLPSLGDPIRDTNYRKGYTQSNSLEHLLTELTSHQLERSEITFSRDLLNKEEENGDAWTTTEVELRVKRPNEVRQESQTKNRTRK